MLKDIVNTPQEECVEFRIIMSVSHDSHPDAPRIHHSQMHRPKTVSFLVKPHPQQYQVLVFAMS